MRPDYMGILFMGSAVMSFNAGIWQVFRRRQKQQLMDNHKNLFRPPATALPPEDANFNDYEFRPVELEGTLDNEGSCLVGPRSLPSFRGAAHIEEEKGGFLVMTPFEIAHTGQFVMLNRGWVPIEAGKHRTMLVQYIGEGFAHLHLRGIFRKEEYLSSSLWGDHPDNDGPVASDLSWLAMRPWNMALHYYRRRWGASSESERLAKHGAHHYYIEMIEDFGGDDQRIVRGHVWPWRRDAEEITYVHVTPIIHSTYIIFWFSVCAGSLFGARRCWQRQKDIFALRRVATLHTTEMQARRQAEGAAYLQSMKEVQQLQQQERAKLSAGSASSGSVAAGTGDSEKDTKTPSE